jgi:hypothetical protein
MAREASTITKDEAAEEVVVVDADLEAEATVKMRNAKKP